MCGFLRRLPQPVMRWQIAISRIKARQTLAQHQEMARLITGHPQLVIKKGARQRGIGVTASHIKRQIDGVQFDMRNGVQQRNASAGRWPDTAARYITRGFQFRPARPAGAVRRSGSANPGDAPAMSVSHQLACLACLFRRLVCAQNDA